MRTADPIRLETRDFMEIIEREHSLTSRTHLNLAYDQLRSLAFSQLARRGLSEARPASDELLSFDGALRQLELDNPLQARIVVLHCFAEVDMSDIAAELELPLSRIKQEWRFARAWLQHRIER